MERIKSCCGHSLTIFWAYLLSAGGLILEVLPPVLDLIASPEVSEPLKAALPSNTIKLFIIFVGVVTYGARMRGLRKET